MNEKLNLSFDGPRLQTSPENDSTSQEGLKKPSEFALFMKIVDQYDLNVKVNNNVRRFTSSTVVKRQPVSQPSLEAFFSSATQLKDLSSQSLASSSVDSLHFQNSFGPGNQVRPKSVSNEELSEPKRLGGKHTPEKRSRNSSLDNEQMMVQLSQIDLNNITDSTDTIARIKIPSLSSMTDFEDTPTDDIKKEPLSIVSAPTTMNTERGRKQLRSVYFKVSNATLQLVSNLLHPEIVRHLELHTTNPDNPDVEVMEWPFNEVEMEHPSVSYLDIQDEAVVISDPRGTEDLRATATLEELIRPLVSTTGTFDKDQMRKFLRTYRYFSEGLDVVRVLALKFIESNLFSKDLKPGGTSQSSNSNSNGGSHPTYEITQMRVLNVFRKWIEFHPKDFAENLALFNFLTQFLTLHVALEPKWVVYTNSIKSILNKCDPSMTLRRNTTSKEELSINDKYLKERNRRFTDLALKYRGEDMLFVQLDPTDISTQLCLLEGDFFGRINPDEFLLQSWNKTHQLPDEDPTPLVDMISWFNKIAYGTANVIVSSSRPRLRLTALKRFIFVAQKCFQNKNYNACFEIIAGLNMSPVSRLKKTWSSLPKKYMEVWDTLNRVLSSEQNFKTYRNWLLKREPNEPAIPYLGLTLRDLVFAEDGNRTYIEERPPKSASEDAMNLSGRVRSINVRKMQQINNIIDDIVAFQSQKYTFEPIPFVQQWIKENFKVVEEETLHQLSIKCEPSDRKSAPPNILEMPSLPTTPVEGIDLGKEKSSSLINLKKRWRVFTS
jgi:hypothetical protein